MAQSPEYPDLRWMPPKSWTDANRTSVQLIVVHTTEGAATASAAEDGASYDQRRTDGTSAHYFHDSTSTVQCVRTPDQAHAARTQGNRRGIQHELCTRAGSADWADTYHQAMLRRAARQAARDSRKWGIPVRRLTVAQVAAGVKGFCGHWDITRAFPQDNGTHTDPGPSFPWSRFLDMVRAELNPEEDDVSAEEVWGTKWKGTNGVEYPASSWLINADKYAARAASASEALRTEVAALRADVAAALGRDLVDEQQIVAGVLAGLSAQAIAAAIPADLARQVADELAARLAT